MKVRNWTAVAAWLRNGGPMKHRNTPRGGQTNESRDYLAQAEEDDVHPSEDTLLYLDNCSPGDEEFNLDFWDTGGVPAFIEASEETFDAFTERIREENVTKPDKEALTDDDS